MSESLELLELCYRMRRMVERDGHGMDRSGDRTGIRRNMIGRRWIWGDIHVYHYSNVEHPELAATLWPSTRCFLVQRDDGKILTRPPDKTVKELLAKLNALMVLDDLAST